MVSCKKKDADVISAFEQLGVGAYVTLSKTNSLTLDYSAINTSQVSITVKEYGKPVDKIKIYVTAGAANRNRSTWKLVKEVPYPTAGADVDLVVRATEIATALGVPPANLNPGTSYTLYNQVITKEGASYDIVNMQADFPTLPNYNMAMTWVASVVCPFTGNMAGNYRVIADQWQDWSPGDVVAVTDGPAANQINLSQVWPNPIYGVTVSPFVVNVNPATGAASVTSGVTIANYTCCGYTAVTGTGSTGFVFSCTGDITLRVRLSAPPFGDQGLQTLTLKKL
jgi:hypothetical protein